MEKILGHIEELKNNVWIDDREIMGRILRNDIGVGNLIVVNIDENTKKLIFLIAFFNFTQHVEVDQISAFLYICDEIKKDRNCQPLIDEIDSLIVETLNLFVLKADIEKIIEIDFQDSKYKNQLGFSLIKKNILIRLHENFISRNHQKFSSYLKNQSFEKFNKLNELIKFCFCSKESIWFTSSFKTYLDRIKKRNERDLSTDISMEDVKKNNRAGEAMLNQQYVSYLESIYSFLINSHFN
jgi:hypothetical protein